MLTDSEFIENSLIANLYYLRTLREFCTRIELSIPSFYKNERDKAARLGKECEVLGDRVVKNADGNIPANALNAGIFFTKYTLSIEKLTNKLLNANISTQVTENEMNIKPGLVTPTPELIKELDEINQEALRIANEFVEFSNELYNDSTNQKIFIYYYNTLNLYLNYEVNFYITVLNRLVNRYSLDPVYVADYEYEFTKLLEAVATFIRGECDPIYVDIINEANDFVIEYGNLANEYENMVITPESQKNMTQNNIELSTRFKAFLEKCLQMILNKELYFISPPVTKDNALTDVNYFLYNLKNIRQDSSV